MARVRVPATLLAALAALWLGASGAHAARVDFHVVPAFSNVIVTIVAESGAPLGDLSGSDVITPSGVLQTDLTSPLGPAPTIEFIPSDLLFTDLLVTLDAGFAGQIDVLGMGLVGTVSGGPHTGSDAGLAPDEWAFDFAGNLLSLNQGAIDVDPQGLVELSIDPLTIDLALAPLDILFGSGPSRLLVADLGAGFFDFTLVMDVAASVVLADIDVMTTLFLDGQITAVARNVAVPEPSAFALILLALGALARVSRQRGRSGERCSLPTREIWRTWTHAASR